MPHFTSLAIQEQKLSLLMIDIEILQLYFSVTLRHIDISVIKPSLLSLSAIIGYTGRAMNTINDFGERAYRFPSSRRAYGQAPF